MTLERITPAIRRATVADAVMLAELGARTFHDTFAADNNHEDMTAYLESAFTPAKLTAELVDPLALFFIAEIDGTPGGYAKLHASQAPEGVAGSKPIELARLYVAQEWLGSGVGEALMRVCFDEARWAGFETMWLGVWEHNERAQKFYRKWAFHFVGSHIFQLGSDPQIDLLMERSLV
jgi:GNAT superfamily N-acetyltransferase